VKIYIMQTREWFQSPVRLALLAATLATSAFAGNTGKISGKITDARTHEGLPAANVVIAARWNHGVATRGVTRFGASTDNNGEYFILNVDPGEYTIEARLLGFATEVVEHVVVGIDRTTRIDVGLTGEDVTISEVVVTADRERIRKDVAYSSKGITAEELKLAPELRLSDLLTNEVGIEQDAYGVTIRGGTEKEVAYNVDGVSMSDNRNNRPYTNVNTELIQDVQLITGGFNAEYSDARSGIVNVVTKQSPDRYTGSVKITERTPGLKHFGPNMWTSGDWWDFGRFQNMKAVQGPAYVNELGQRVNSWMNERGENIDRDKNGVPDFQGWEAYAASGLNQYHLTPADCYKLWKYQHRTVEFANELGVDPVLHYGDKRDYNIEASFAGPVWPFGESPGSSGLDFAGGYSKKFNSYAYQLSRDGTTEENGQVRINFRPDPSTKISLFGLYGTTSACGWFLGEDHSYVNNPGYIIQNTYGVWALGGLYNLYAVDNNSNWIDWTHRNLNFSLEHFINKSTYFEVNGQMTSGTYDATPPPVVGTTTYVNKQGKLVHQYDSDFQLVNTLGDTIHFPSFPRGFDYNTYPEISGGYVTDQNGYYLHTLLDGWGYDQSSLQTYSLKFDFSSQLDNHHLLKSGLMWNANHVIENRWAAYPRTLDAHGELIGYAGTHFEERFHNGGAYVQDKIEYPSLVINLGVRYDFYYIVGDQPDVLANPNRPDLYGAFMRDTFIDALPTISRRVPVKWAISPRFGIAHPITEDTKLYFNYGHFTQIPTTHELYWLRYGNIGSGGRLEFVGNPFLPLPKTISYEVGFEHDFGDIGRMTLSGYYKDARNQPQFVEYNNGNPNTEFFSYEDESYWTQKGFELQFFRRNDRWIKGFVNLSWFLTTYGIDGTTNIRPDDLDLQNLNIAAQARTLSRLTFDPIIKAKAGIYFSTPEDFGPEWGGFRPFENWHADFVVKWRQGSRFHWDTTGQTDATFLNYRWKDYWMVDLKIEKDIKLGGFDLSFYCNINNLFNIKNFNVTDFGESEYEGADYYQAPGSAAYTFAAFGVDTQEEFNRYMTRIVQTGKTPGAQVEDAYMPKRSYLTYLFPREYWFGVRLAF
jgi:hypothetical protein